ncbi:glycosyltransferase [Marinobacter lipolyticus]|uniref:glycosyltransferase n=1 Tax=Marinobacter lipolyticus TaxID=209639 RepID=UPI001BCD5CAA|nr:glycosyltransferase [Marinobacter lipolyticus]MBS8238967.1 glycosyltransferase [Marinobacter lipolyticus]
MNPRIEVSFIIPCFNEISIIPITIKKIMEQADKNNLIYEIVVVDNMSTDGSFEEVKKLNIDPIRSKGKTVAEVRNHGFKRSKGEILVFLDSDVVLGDEWGGVFLNIVNDIRVNRVITGSHCSVPENLRQPFFSWYKGIEKDVRNTHLGTGHLIVHRDVFRDIGMFDESMTSGEDYEFCQRARLKGATIKGNEKLKVYHMGYPDGVFSFIARESWHGISDFKKMKYFLNSKIAMMSVLFVFLHIFLFYHAFAHSSFAFFVTLGSIFLFLAVSVIKKFSYDGFRDFLFKVVVAYLYFVGRSISAFRALG